MGFITAKEWREQLRATKDLEKTEEIFRRYLQKNVDIDLVKNEIADCEEWIQSICPELIDQYDGNHETILAFLTGICWAIFNSLHCGYRWLYVQQPEDEEEPDQSENHQ